jgi:hypothetical protein
MLDRSKKTILRASCLAIGVVAVAGLASATIPDSAHVIHGCYNPSQNNKLRVIDTDKGQKCTKAEKPLNWNQSGPPGTNGTSGTDGTDGTSIVARPRWTGNQDLPNPNAPVTVSVGSWSQGATEVNQVIPGTVTFDLDPGCNIGEFEIGVRVPGWGDSVSGGPLEAFYDIRDIRNTNNSEAVEVTTPIDQRVEARTASGEVQALLSVFEPGAATPRSLSVTFEGVYACPLSGQHVTVTAMSFDVAAMR